jgi:hypothetical protein
VGDDYAADDEDQGEDIEERKRLKVLRVSTITRVC